MEGELIPDGATIALDTMLFAYQIEGNVTYEDVVGRLFTRMVSGDLSGVASTLVVAELLVPYVKHRAPAHAAAVLRAIRALANLALVPVTAEIAARSAELRAEFGLRTPDAVHLATAIDRGAASFLTNDRRLGRISVDGCSVHLLEDLVPGRRDVQ
jgi:predicted nucleic acid-binding protein